MNARTSQAWKVEMLSTEGSSFVDYYEDFRVIRFHCTVAVDGSMFIFVGEPSRWAKDYPWAALRRYEILTRVAQSTIAPGLMADVHDDKGYILVREEKQAV